MGFLRLYTQKLLSAKRNNGGKERGVICFWILPLLYTDNSPFFAECIVLWGFFWVPKPLKTLFHVETCELSQNFSDNKTNHVLQPNKKVKTSRITIWSRRFCLDSTNISKTYY